MDAEFPSYPRVENYLPSADSGLEMTIYLKNCLQDYTISELDTWKNVPFFIAT